MKILYDKYTKTGEIRTAEPDDESNGIEIRKNEEGRSLKPTRLLHKEVR